LWWGWSHAVGGWRSASLEVGGSGQRTEVRGQRTENRKKMTEDKYSPVGAAFQPRSCNFIAFYVVNESTNALIL